MELNREQIAKALECCSKDDCDNCPNTFGNCYSNLAGFAIALIRELTEERDQLDLTLAGVMHFVDKWLEGEELEQDETNRAATMREKTLRIAEENERLKAQAEMWKTTAYCEKDRCDTLEAAHHAEWIVTERGCVISCSKCGYRLELCHPDGTEVRSLPHCPVCGAKIDGGSGEK